MHGVLGRRCPEFGARHPPGAHGRDLAAGWLEDRGQTPGLHRCRSRFSSTRRHPGADQQPGTGSQKYSTSPRPCRRRRNRPRRSTPAPRDVGHGSTLSRRSTQGEPRTVMMARPDACRGSRAHRPCRGFAAFRADGLAMSGQGSLARRLFDSHDRLDRDDVETLKPHPRTRPDPFDGCNLMHRTPSG
jgi:hypothetical protein